MREYYLSLINGSRQGIIAVFLRAVLRVFSWIYHVTVMLLRRAYQAGLLRSYNLGCPVISIGNITWGGAGKTPLVEWLAKGLLAHGKKPVILMRGYMPASSRGGCGCQSKSDEAEFLRESLKGKVPVIANKDRVQGALMVPADYARDVFVLDDGFQHWRVKRDMNIVVIDALDPFGNGALIPRGSLREPLSALKYADVCVISRADLAPDAVTQIREEITAIVPGMRFVEAAHQPVSFCHLKTGADDTLLHIQNRPVVLVSGIGSPQGFERTVRSLGADIKQHVIYSDHHCYQALDIQQILYCLEKHNVQDVIITTKDAVKIKGFIGVFPENINVLSLAIEMQMMKGEEVLTNAVLSAIHA